MLGKHESEGTPHQAIDSSAPPVSVLGERELEEARRKGKEESRGTVSEEQSDRVN